MLRLSHFAQDLVSTAAFVVGLCRLCCEPWRFCRAWAEEGVGDVIAAHLIGSVGTCRYVPVHWHLLLWMN